MTLTEIAIKRPSLIIVFFLALSLMGIFGYSQLKYELLPEISIPVISIITVYPGASAKEVENGVTKKIEDAVSTLDKVDGVYSTSQENVSTVVIEFVAGANLDILIQDTQRKVNASLANLPDGAEAPTISKISINDQPVMRLGATGNLATRDFYQLMKDQIKPELSRIPGVGQVDLVGGEEREIKVNLDALRLQSYGLSITEVVQAVRGANLDFPTGNVKDSDAQFTVRLAGKFNSLEELRQLAIDHSEQGGVIRLGDIAEVQDGRKEDTNLIRVNGRSAVGILIQKQSDANAVEVCKAVRLELQQLEKEYHQKGLDFEIAEDSSLFTIDSANAVKEDLGIAILLVACVMLVFLHSIRNSIIVLVAIPASLISTFIGIWVCGFTLNLITLLALSLVIGILVDDSIVVLENIYRHLEKGESRRDAALLGRNEIGFTALSITMVDVVVFLPLSLVTGTIGGMMREFALVVVFATLMSLLVSFTITPMLASRFTKREQFGSDSLMGRFGEWFEKQYQRLTRLYLEILEWSLGNRWMVISAALLLFCSVIALVPLGFVGAEFIPQTDRGEFVMNLELAPGAKLEQTNQATQVAEAVLAKTPEIERVFVNVGASTSGFVGLSASQIAEINVSLVPKGERRRSTDQVAQELKAKITQRLPGTKIRVYPVAIWGSAEGAPIQFMISGSNWDEVSAAANRVVKIMKAIPGTDDVRLSAEEGKPELRLEIDREKLAALGLSLAEVGAALRVGLSGDTQSQFRDQDGVEHDTRIILDQFDRSQTAELTNLTVLNRSGQPVALKQFANIYQSTGPTKLQRRDRNYSITLTSQALGRPSGDIGKDINQAIGKAQFPPGIRFAFGGDIEQQEKSFASLGLVMLAAIIFVYLIMVALYDSFIYPLVVLFSVPLAIIGAILTLGLTMNALNIFTILGIIMQVGLVSKNAILLVDFTNKLRSEGQGVAQALLEAGRERLRPILMTTLTMILGMMPIALSKAPAAEFKNGLGWALIGGLTCSMLMTLVIVPVVYYKVDQWRGALFKLKGKLFGSSGEIAG